LRAQITRRDNATNDCRTTAACATADKTRPARSRLLQSAAAATPTATDDVKVNGLRARWLFPEVTARRGIHLYVDNACSGSTLPALCALGTLRALGTRHALCSGTALPALCALGTFYDERVNR
jgi:hypothetical protein